MAPEGVYRGFVVLITEMENSVSSKVIIRNNKQTHTKKKQENPVDGRISI